MYSKGFRFLNQLFSILSTEEPFFNASNFHIPFGRLTAYGSVGRAQGRLIPIIPQTKDNLVFRDAGISIMPDTYQHFNDELYLEESRGYKPGQQVSILEKGDILLPLWKDVFKFQSVSVKNKVNASSVSQAKKDIKKKLDYFLMKLVLETKK